MTQVGARTGDQTGAPEATAGALTALEPWWVPLDGATGIDMTAAAARQRSLDSVVDHVRGAIGADPAVTVEVALLTGDESRLELDLRVRFGDRVLRQRYSAVIQRLRGHALLSAEPRVEMLGAEGRVLTTWSTAAPAEPGPAEPWRKARRLRSRRLRPRHPGSVAAR